MQFKLISKSDEVYLWQTYKIAMKTHIENIWGWQQTWQKDDFAKSLAKFTTCLIQIKDETVGYIQYKIEKNDGYINMLILEPTKQSQGLGGKVIKHLIAKNHLHKLSLKCFKINKRAYEFYLKEGFSKIEEEAHFYLLKK